MLGPIALLPCSRYMMGFQGKIFTDPQPKNEAFAVVRQSISNGHCRLVGESYEPPRSIAVQGGIAAAAKVV